jgi:hypothetical protein
MHTTPAARTTRRLCVQSETSPQSGGAMMAITAPVPWIRPMSRSPKPWAFRSTWR